MEPRHPVSISQRRVFPVHGAPLGRRFEPLCHKRDVGVGFGQAAHLKRAGVPPKKRPPLFDSENRCAKFCRWLGPVDRTSDRRAANIGPTHAEQGLDWFIPYKQSHLPCVCMFEEEAFAWKRPIKIGLLATVGLSEHSIAHLAEQEIDFQAGLF